MKRESAFRSRGLMQSVSRKTRNILDRLTIRRTRTSSADGQLYLGDGTSERAASPTLSSVSHVRSTSMIEESIKRCTSRCFSSFV